MRSLCAGVLLLLTASAAWAGPHPPPPEPPRVWSFSWDPAALRHDLKGAAIGGVFGALTGWAIWSDMSQAGTATVSRRRAIVGVMFIGMAVGFDIASSSAPHSPNANRAPAVASRLAIGSNTSLQPVIARRGGAAVVRLRF